MTFEIPSDVTAGLAQMERWNLGPVKLELTGTQEVMLNISHILVVAEEAAIRRLEHNIEKGMEKSKEQCPWDETHLLQTATVEPGDEPNTYMAGYNSKYGHYQHENLTFRHPKPGTKAKFLEDPFMELVPTIAADIADALKGVLQ
jgi:hypothetical protein